MLYLRLREEIMKITNIRKLIATFGATALILSGASFVATSAHASDPVCTTVGGAETCNGTLSNGAAYKTVLPGNFNGTFFFWQHGFRSSYPYPGYTPPKGVEELTPYSNNTGKDVTKDMLASGYGIAAYDCSSTGLHGWNTADCVEMLKDLITTTKAKYTIAHSVVYGSSMAGAVLTPFIEKYPNLADAVGIMAGVTPPVTNEIRSGCDMFYIFSVFFDPTIKGCTVMGTKGVPGHYAVLGDFAKVATLLTAWSKNLGAPGLEYPAALKGSGIPQRSALLLAGLIAGLPTKSAHMDGISTSALIPEQSINSTVAILENTQELLGTAYFAGQAISELVGPGFYDNTKTDYSALLSDADAGRFNLGLSGDNAITAMLGVLAASPRITGDPAAMTKAAALDKSSFNTSKPVVLLSNEADRLVLAGNSQLFVNKEKVNFDARLAAWQAKYDAASLTDKLVLNQSKPVWNVLAMYALTPETYTKFDATTGVPLLTKASLSPSGVGHQSFTQNQTMSWVKILAQSAKSGKIPPKKYIDVYLSRDRNFNKDPDYQPGELKYQD